MFKRSAGWVGTLAVIACCVALFAPITSAETIQSPNYQMDESVIGSDDIDQSSSANYQASNASGDLVVGNSASSNYQIDGGSQTTNDPALSFAITGSSVDLGSFTASNPTVATNTFSVSNYTSYGYVVQIVGSQPTNGSHTIDAMPVADFSQVGTEQFGINLVANTLPVSVGSNPDNGQFGFGTVATDYATANKYRFVSGDTIASAPKSSGVTNYTISYLINVASLTPGGQYTNSQTLVITGTY